MSEVQGKPAVETKMVTMEEIMFEAYIRMIDGMCDVDKNVLVDNYRVMGNALPSEKRISLDVSMFLANHINSILVGLLFDHNNTRNLFVKAIETEINLDNMEPEARAAARAEMMTPKIKNKSHGIEIGVSVFSNSMMQKFMEAMASNHKKFGDKFGDKFNAKLNELTVDEKQMLSIILSSYGYLLRAFNYNGTFLDEVIAVVKSVEQTYYGK